MLRLRSWSFGGVKKGGREGGRREGGEREGETTNSTSCGFSIIHVIKFWDLQPYENNMARAHKLPQANGQAHVLALRLLGTQS